MDTKRIDEALGRLFKEEGKRIVFWNDPEREFSDTIASLQLDDVQVLYLDETGALGAKIRIEREDPEGRYLVYTSTEEPDYEDDWLLDIRLYSGSFRADRASIILDELGLANQYLRPHLNERRRFFDSKERSRKLKVLVTPDDTEADLDRKIIAVLVRADQPELFNIVRTLFHAFTEGEDVDLSTPPPTWEQVEKFGLDDPFWQMVKASFGYEEDPPSLQNLLIRLLVTDYAHHLKGDVVPSLQHLLLPGAGTSNAVVCLDQWRDSSSKGSSYDRLSSMVGKIIKLRDHLYHLEIDSLLDVMTFLEVEKAIMSRLRDRVASTSETIDTEEIREIASRRQDGHWASASVSAASDVPRRAVHAVYDALVSAADFFALRNMHKDGFYFDNAGAMYHAYESELFRFDQLYRHFCEAADQTESQGWGILKPLRDDVEACYGNWYVTSLALSWGKFVDLGRKTPSGSASLLDNWQIGQVPRQPDFFSKHVRLPLREARGRKVYVIISDAFRYEVAQELTRELNGRYRFQAELRSQLGVLPSYTALGMASLLPHRKLTYKANGDILVDGKPASSMAQRHEILASVHGVVIRADDLLAMKKKEGREFVRDKQVIYVYHNAIDAVGDKASTEKDTFAGVRRAIDEIGDVVRYIINSLNGHQVLVTADHGFLFQETPPGEPDKSALPEKPDGTVVAKKRYLLGRDLPDHKSVWHGTTETTARAEGEMEFWIPRGANRFHFTGGARFVHGGAMLQEVVVPIVEVRHARGKAVSKTKSKQVTVQVLGTSHRITTSRHRFELIQMEAVGDRVKPITLKVGVYEGDEPVTNIETVTFDSASENMDDRRKWVHLVLQSRQYDKKTPYRLVLRDAETGIEQQSVEVVIDRAFTDDF